MRHLPLQAILVACFVVIAVCAIGAIDFVTQARLAGSPASGFSISSYMATIKGRFTDAEALREAQQMRQEMQAKAPRELLPYGPDGWSRRDWTEADEARLDPRYDMAKDDFVPDSMKQDQVMQTLTALDRAAAARRDAEEVWVYEKAPQIMSMRLHRMDRQAGGIAGFAAGVVSANLRALSPGTGYAMVGGVAWRDEGKLKNRKDAEAASNGTRVLTARIGDALMLEVRAKASDEAIMDLLTGLDYDRLNGMLEVPVAGDGNDAPVLDPETSKLMAAAALAQDDAEMHSAARAAMDRLAKVGASGDPAAVLGLVLDSYADLGEPQRERLEAAFEEANAVEEIEPAPTEAAESEGGGFLSKLIGGGEKDVAAAAPPPVTFNCTVTKGIKRCSSSN